MNEKVDWYLVYMVFLAFVNIAIVGFFVYLEFSKPNFRPAIITRPNQFYVPPTNQELP